VPSKLRIIVSGLAALHPVGGMAWHYFQYVIGLSRLGHEVCYHEDTWTWPYDPQKNANSNEGDYSAVFIRDYFNTYAPELSNSWHYLHLHEKSFGMSMKQFEEFAKTADIFFNISGANFIPQELSSQCVKVFVDTDPGYNQVLLSEKFEWSKFVDRWAGLVAEHDVYFSFGENINGHDCTIPKLGWTWHTTRMPVVLDLWSTRTMSSAHCKDWTTVMSWKVFKGPVIYNGTEYGDKSVEFDKILTLPKRANISAVLALGGGKSPTEVLQENHWQLLDAPSATKSALDYQKLIWGSRGEISIAKNIYVAMRTGWFSDRSACYLASGKPVILQDTGFSNTLPVGRGLMAFNSLDEAVAAVNYIEADYQLHSRAAIEIAREEFDSNKVLGRMLSVIQC
jgi:hypothetical protein